MIGRCHQPAKRCSPGGIPRAELDLDLPREPTLGYATQRFFLSWKQTGQFGADEAVLSPPNSARWSGNLESGLVRQSDECQEVQQVVDEGRC